MSFGELFKAIARACHPDTSKKPGKEGDEIMSVLTELKAKRDII